MYFYSLVTFTQHFFYHLPMSNSRAQTASQQSLPDFLNIHELKLMMKSGNKSWVWVTNLEFRLSLGICYEFLLGTNYPYQYHHSSPLCIIAARLL